MTVPVDWFCQFADPLPVNGLCGNKQGKCDSAAGLSCVGGVCAAATTTTTVNGCQLPGDAMCFSASNPIGPTGDACCNGALCQPWLADGETLTVPVDWFCQYADPIPVNGLCGNKQGKCDSAAGLSCVEGVCATATTTTTTTTTTKTATTVNGCQLP